jgi:hypothetical protein
LWSAGIVLAGVVGLAQISALLAIELQEKELTVMQRLREWYLDAAYKSGKKRREWDVTSCFAPLLRLLVRLWDQEQKRLPLAIDATTLTTRWTVLAISVLICGCAIPVAWKVFPAHQKGSWRPLWQALFTALEEAIPQDWEVIVLADRGLYAGWLWDLIRTYGWHPFLRLNNTCTARRAGSEGFEKVTSWVPTPGTHWKGRVECFHVKKCRITGTLFLHWEEGYQDPWIILTDLVPEEAHISWYGLRTWIEGGFKDFKRGLWGWQHHKMTRASQVERMWLAMSIAQVWCVSVGRQAEVEREAQVQEHEPGADLPERHIARRRRTRPAGTLPPRRLSCVVRGRLLLQTSYAHGQVLPLGRLIPQPWPEKMTPPQKLPKKPAVRDPRRNMQERARKARQKQKQKKGIKIKKS